MEPPDMEFLTLDCSALRSLQELHAALHTTLSLPFYYGRTFDALYDCLTELSQPVRLEIRNLSQSGLGAAGGVLQRVLQDAAGSNPNFNVFFSENP